MREERGYQDKSKCSISKPRLDYVIYQLYKRMLVDIIKNHKTIMAPDISQLFRDLFPASLAASTSPFA